MFHFYDIDDLDTKNNFKKNFGAETETWLVADLHAKSRLQTELLQATKCLPEDCVLRASELWRKILHAHFPDIDVTSNQFMSAVLAEWLKGQDIAWAQHPGTPKILLQYIGEFLPILGHQENTARVVEWLKENPEAFMRWGNWFVLAYEAWRHFCSQKILANSWVSSYLSGQDWPVESWTRNLIVDAGANFSGVEVDLLQRLSQSTDIHVFAPSKDWTQAYPGTLWPYDILLNRGLSDKKRILFQEKEGLKTHRFTTSLAEVKSATGQVRAWLESGVSPSQIGVVAADIEAYWPSLSAYFKKEGLPVDKETVISASSCPGIARWLARLSVESRDIETGHLELAMYRDQKTPPIEFNRFEQLFNRIYGESDLDREPAVKKFFDLRVKADDRMNRDQFFSWAIQYWADEVSLLERVAADFLQECPSQTTLELRSWLSYLCSVTAKIEIRISESQVGGVFCGNLENAQSAKLTHVIVLGLSEKEMRPMVDLNLTHADIQRIGRDLGILLNSPDRDENEFLASRLAQAKSSEVDLYFSASDFSGQAQAPSLFWLQEALAKKQDLEACVSPCPTRWDEIQKSPPSDEMLEKVSPELGLSIPSSSPLAVLPTLSASQLEKYLNCPFIFTAEKLFHLSDLPDVDLDIDAMTSGRLMHGVVERLLESPLRWDRSEAELLQMIDSLRSEFRLPLGDERLWPAKRQQFVRVAQQFLQFEQEWRKSFPQTQTVARELKVRGEWAVQPGQVVRVAGRIDRVDSFSLSPGQAPQYVVIDYKSSSGGLHSWGSWLENDEIQLAFYAMALQEGLTELEPGEVIGAFYYVVRGFQREKGFRVRTAQGPLFGENNRNRSSLSADEVGQLLDKVREKISATVKKIESGVLGPSPRDIKDCDKCKWSTVCRAPHLS
jgi:ATP-dependent helicase/nuclease subunit B